MSVLVDPDGPLDDTVAAARAITLRDLLTFTLGTGIVLPSQERAADALPLLAC